MIYLFLKKSIQLANQQIGRFPVDKIIMFFIENSVQKEYIKNKTMKILYPAKYIYNWFTLLSSLCSTNVQQPPSFGTNKSFCTFRVPHSSVNPLLLCTVYTRFTLLLLNLICHNVYFYEKDLFIYYKWIYHLREPLTYNTGFCIYNSVNVQYIALHI